MALQRHGHAHVMAVELEPHRLLFLLQATWVPILCFAVLQQQGHSHAGEIAAAGAGAAAGGALFAASRPRHDEPQRATAQGHPIQVM
jgi:hypothetical protein